MTKLNDFQMLFVTILSLVSSNILFRFQSKVVSENTELLEQRGIHWADFHDI
jgi:hypothetical protein